MIDIAARVASLPGPSLVAGAITDDLCMGRGVVWVFPRPAPVGESVAEVLRRLSDASISTQVVRLTCINGAGEGEKDDASALDDTFQRVTGKAAPRELLDGRFAPIVVVVDALDLGDKATRRAVEAGLMATFQEWCAQSMEDYRESGVFAGVVMLVRGTTLGQLVPQKDHIRTRWHWGTVTVAELCLLAREIAVDLGLGWEKSTWMQWVGSEVAGTDAGLLVYLCEYWDPAEGIEQLTDVLRRYAEEQGWTADDFASVPRNLGEPFSPGRSRRPSCPPRHLAALYDAGMLDWEAERGLHIHSAALALAGDAREISHRVWAGQAGYLLPLFDRERLEICRRLNDEIKDWRACCARVEDRSYSSLTIFNSKADKTPAEGFPVMELADMRQYLDRNSSGLTAALFKRVDFLVKARNCLAHYTPLSWENFSAALRWDRTAEEFAGKR